MSSALASDIMAARPARPPRSRRWLLILPALAFLALFFALPLLQNAQRSLEPQSGGMFANYAKLLTDSYYLGVVKETLVVSFNTTVLALVVGYPIAYYMVRRAGRMALPLLFLLVAPLLTSIIMRTFGWRVLFARRGIVNDALLSTGLIDKPLNLLNGPFSVYVGQVHVLVPFMVLSIIPVLRAVDTRLEESARVLGAGALRTFLTVTLPLSKDGIVTGVILVFMLSTGSFITQLLLGNGSVVTLPLLIFQQFSLTQDLGLASAMGNLLLMIVLACLFVQLRLTDGKRGAR
ncbi:ABC transporter permease [Bordetella ansorpii]|uniref:ABC transporter permease n=1 Tax=Bordetella ansorpii TaxID=288768 RepID=A0A157RCH0_9BORD|nr:ABC transporter permease [Bordetella ansorpii]SAI55735.1 ABC transporter permease [Bordetella ansorpii]